MIHSGYKTVTPIQLANAFWALNQGLINQRIVRVYLACFAMVAVREAAARCRLKRREKPRETSRYRINELERLTSLDAAKVRRALRELERHGLVAFSENEIVITRETLPGSEAMQEALACRRSPRRPIPVPRSLLRFLSRTPSTAVSKTVVAYLVRGLSIGRSTGEIGNKGTVKASWIVDTFGLSQRAIRYAQAHLRELSWISKDTKSVQRKLNRDGAYFVINLEWKFVSVAGVSMHEPESLERKGKTQLVNRDKAVLSFAPPASKIAPDFAPPIENKKTSIERKHQETQPTERRVVGVWGKGRKIWPEPSLKNILRDDLYHFSRLERLYFEAVERGWISASESAALNFIAAAVKAREVGDDPVRLFVALVRRGLWHHINQGQEDCARRALARHREANPERFRDPVRSRNPDVTLVA